VIILSWLIFRIAGSEPAVQFLTRKAKTIIFSALILILIPYSWKTIVRNNHWNIQYTLIKADIDHLTRSAKANFIYAGTLKTEILKALRGGVAMNPRIQSDIDDIQYRLKLAIDLYPDYYQAWELWGTIYSQILNDHAAAIPYFDKSLAIKEDYVPGLVGRGYSYYKLQQLEDAFPDMNRVVELDPENLQANGTLYAIYRERGDMERAMYYGQRAKELKEEMEKKFGKNREE
jgi:tetratricopeptide (TPR) repeat protein